MPHWICGVVMRSVITENGSGGSSPGCISTTDHRRRLIDATGRPVSFAEMDQPAQEGPGGDDDSARGQLNAIGQTEPGDAAVRDNQIVGLAFDDAEIGGLADRGLHGRGVELAIGLGARTPHRRTLATIEHAKLNAGGIGHPAHESIQRIDLADQMALAETTDRRIAGHRADGRKAMRHQCSHGSHARSRAGGLATGVAASNNNDVESFRVGDHAGLLSQSEETRKT